MEDALDRIGNCECDMPGVVDCDDARLPIWMLESMRQRQNQPCHRSEVEDKLLHKLGE